MSKNVVIGLFADYSTASAVVREVEALGVAHSDISLLANQVPSAFDRDHREVHDALVDVAADEPTGVGTATGVGAAAGLATGFFAGVGALAIPGFGPLIAAGIFASMLGGAVVGAAAGGVAGLLMDSGVSGDHAEFYNTQVQHYGRSLVTVHVADADVFAVEAIMNRHGRILPPGDAGLVAAAA